MPALRRLPPLGMMGTRSRLNDGRGVWRAGAYRVASTRYGMSLGNADHCGGGGDRGQLEAGARKQLAKLSFGALKPARQVHHGDVEILGDGAAISGRHDALDDKQSASRRNDVSAVTKDLQALLIGPVVKDVPE
jgi:hypothetical protein